MDPRFLVYALIDPRTGAVRYIGKSSTGMRRPRQHINKCYLAGDDYKARWIRQLLSLGLTYEIAILDVCVDCSTLPSSRA